jgi:hypothetical protein
MILTIFSVYQQNKDEMLLIFFLIVIWQRNKKYYVRTFNRLFLQYNKVMICLSLGIEHNITSWDVSDQIKYMLYNIIIALIETLCTKGRFPE